MKRKALITATAVLLVAVMCLATASYAWFTAGTASEVTSFKVTVSEGDTGLYIAPASIVGATPTYKVGTFTKDAITAALAGNAFISSTLKPVSTNGKFNAGKVNFFEAAADKFDGTYWDVDAVNAANTTEDSGYILFGFYVKSTAATETLSYNVNLGGDILSDPAAKKAVKIGYTVIDTTVTDDVVAAVVPGTDDALTLCGLGETDTTKYKPVIATGTDAIQKVGGQFVAANDFTGLDSTVTVDNTLSAPVLEFAEGDDACLVVIGLWLEGQDEDCSGNFGLTDKELTVTLTAANS